MALRILIVDDHVLIREAFRDALNNVEGFEVVGEAGDGRDAVEMVRRFEPDIVLMDISLPGLNGVEATRKIVLESGHSKVLVLSMHTDRVLVLEILKAGASGFIEKQSSFEEVVKGINSVARGQTYISPRVAGLVVDGFLGRTAVQESDAYTILTPREREVLQLLAEGNSTRQVAEIMQVSLSTVETFRRQLKKKLNIKSFAGLVKFAIREGLTGL